MAIIVHSMGKCATRSIVKYIQQSGKRAYQLHYLHQKPRILDNDITGVVVPIREPVSRNISAYFENFHTSNDKVSTREFLFQYPHHVPLLWFDFEFRNVWNVDIYQVPFDTKRGWSLFKHVGITFAIIRYENIDALPAVLESFGMKPAVVPHIGDTASKKSAYATFLETQKLPEYYLDFMRKSKYYKHFYGDNYALQC